MVGERRRRGRVDRDYGSGHGDHGRHRRQPSHALFGAFLRGMRAQIAGTLVSVSRGCGRSPGWLSRYERGSFVHPPTFEDLRVLCGILGINPVDLLLDCGFVTEAEVVEAAQGLGARTQPTQFARRAS